MALASQSIRPQAVPRSSVALNRRSGGARGKRLIGIVLLAGLCVGMGLWAARSRDNPGPGNPLGPAAAAGAPTPTNPAPNTRPGDTAPAATSLLSPDPHGASTPAGEAAQGLVMGNASRAAQPVTQPSTPPPATTPAVHEPLAAQPAPAAEPALPSGAGYAAAAAAAERAVQQQRLPEARTILNRALLDPASSAADRANLRQKLTELNQTLLFGPAQFPGDPLSETYRVVSGDVLNKINRKLSLITEPSLIARVNKLGNANALKVGQTLKVIRGPFHVVVSKSAFRMDIYAGPTPGPSSLGTANLPDGAEPGWTYICSYPVGLGAQSLTPIGNFTIKEGSKLVNPHWANPRTGEKFDKDDPKNPIGERWMALTGLDDKSKAVTGYGIHGTIDPASIGREMSMGCVRMNAADVEVVYELLTGRVSVVKIVP
jgi:LysM repeat protein